MFFNPYRHRCVILQPIFCICIRFKDLSVYFTLGWINNAVMDAFIAVSWLTDLFTDINRYKTRPEELSFVLAGYYDDLNTYLVFRWDVLGGWRRNRCSRLATCCPSVKTRLSLFCPSLDVYRVFVFLFCKRSNENVRNTSRRMGV